MLSLSAAMEKMRLPSCKTMPMTNAMPAIPTQNMRLNIACLD
jgi:hypothetical protein